MSRLNFGSYARILKKSTTLSNAGVVDLLVAGLKVSSKIDPSDKNKLFNSNIDIEYIKDAAKTIKTKKSIEEYFDQKVIPELSEITINELVELLKIIITKDKTICESDAQELLLNANKEHLPQFLSHTFLFAATRPNKTKAETAEIIREESSIISIRNGYLYLNGIEVPLPEKLTVPQEIDNSEAVYILELLKAYAEKQKVESYTIETLPIKYKKEIERHRQDFYSAEAVRRKTREISIDAENEFDNLKNDTYEGIVDTHSMEYSNAYERLLAVLQQVVKLNSGKSLLWQLPKWISSSEKKGICHILVNEKRISWVVEDE